MNKRIFTEIICLLLVIVNLVMPVNAKDNHLLEMNTDILLPEQDSILGKDFDSEFSTETWLVFMNVDNQKNKPALKEWKDITVTDGVAEYFEMLEENGYQIEVTGYEKNTPRKGFDVYEANFTVTLEDKEWNLYLMIQNEKYIEYDFEIYL